MTHGNTGMSIIGKNRIGMRHGDQGQGRIIARTITQAGIRRFHERDMMLWNSGHWQRARHNGRIGWWWVVGPSWYFYPAPIYPVPDPYRPPMVEGPAGPPQPVWYYCDRPAGYYPYVAECRHWQVVPAQ